MKGDRKTHVRTPSRFGDRLACDSALLLFVGWSLTCCGDGPRVPHPVESTTDGYCLECHDGKADAPVGDHNDKSNCTSCHEATRTGPYPELMPHRAGNNAKCVLCHAEGKAGAPRTLHIDEFKCLDCHRASDSATSLPIVTHAIESRDDSNCLGCHKDLSHGELPQCLGCHES